MKKIISLLTAVTLLVTSVSGLTVLAQDNTPIVSYNDATMSGMGLAHLCDGDYTTSYQSEDAPDMTEDKQYFQYDWPEAVNVNQVTLYSQYCGAEGKDGQAPTKWKILTSTDGTNYAEATTVSAEWLANDELQSKTVNFDAGQGFKSMRIVITEANLNWNHYAIYEIEMAEIAENTTTVSYNDTAMSGMGLAHLYDGDLTTSYVSEDAPDMSDGKQYFQYDWSAPVDVNLVTLYSQFCGTEEKDGQAPTKWNILTSTDGVNYTEATTVSATWYANDNLQSKTVKFDAGASFTSMRIVIAEANLDWNHYSIYEIKTDTVDDSYIIEDLTGEPEITPPVNPPVNPPAETTLTVSYNDLAMSGMGLAHLYDGDLTTSYQSEDAPDMTEGKQYFQYDWSAPVDVNLVALYSQFCGAGEKDGQAPTEWKILTSTDGVNYKEVTTVSASWYENDDLQSKTVKFDVGESFTSMRIVINKANLDWNHYSIYEIKMDTVDDNYIIQDLTGTIPEQPALNSYVDANGVTQYGNCAQISYNDKAMSGMGLGFVSDKDKTTAYVSEENPDMSDGKQYIQYDWAEPIDINMVTVYSQFCGTKLKDGQAPTEWSILVSTDGVNYTKVCDVNKNWRSNDNLQSKVTQFDTQENIVSLRIVFNDANLGWGHYAIYEIEVGNAPTGYQAVDLTGIGDGIQTAPKTGDNQSVLPIAILFAVSMISIAMCLWIRNKQTVGETYGK